MSRQVVFLIHGVGVHPPGWSKPIVALLDEIGARYPTVDGKISTQIDFVEICYGDVFDAQLARWDQDLATLKTNALYPHVEDALDWLDGASKGGFAWTHVGDVVLFLSRITRMAAVAKVTGALADGIAKNNDGDTEFSILAHSLGTAMAMEAVNALATPAPALGWAGLLPKFLFREVLMVANTSRLLQRKDLQAYTQSPLLPKKYAPHGRCVTYRNIFHRLDPIAWARRFDLQALEGQGYWPFAVDHYYGRNIHALDHYLEHPALHGPLLRLPGANNLPAKDLRTALDAYHKAKRFGGEFAKLAEVDQFVDDVASVTKPNPEKETDLLGHLRFIVDVLKKMQ
jgi:hypothetical protein